MPWDPSSPTTDGNVSPEHWYRSDDAYEENTRITACSDDGDPVGSWTDLTGNADHVSQANSANKPTWKDAILNGFPVLRFDGSSDYLTGVFTSGGALSQPFTVVIVAALDAAAVNDNNYHFIMDGDDNVNRMVNGAYAASTPDEWGIDGGGGTWLTGNATNSNWNIWISLFNGASSQFWHNGVSEASGNAGTDDPDGLTVGARYDGTANFWDGDIAEIIIYDSALSAADRDEIGWYLEDRYGISYSGNSPSLSPSSSESPSESPSLSPSSSNSPSESPSLSPSSSESPSYSPSSSESPSLSPSSSESPSESPSLSPSSSESPSESPSYSPSSSISPSESPSYSPSSSISPSESPSLSPSASESPSPSPTPSPVWESLHFAQYRIWLCDWTGTKIRMLFPGRDFLRIQWEHKRNQPGGYRLELVAETDTKDYFLKHYQVLIERDWSNDPAYWYDEYTGFHLGNHEWWVNGDEIDEHYWASMGLSPEWLIDQPLLQPVANVGNTNWAYYDLWWDFGAADDTIKRMVSESMVGPADTDRQFTNVSLQEDSSQGTESCFEGSWVRLLDAVTDAIGETGDKGNCDFRAERVLGGYEFRTYAPFFGTDRRRGNPDGNKPTIFSFENGNMRNPDYKEIWAEEVTVAYGGWQGGGMERSIYTRENDTALAESPYSRREGFYDLRDVSQSDQINGILDQALIDDGLQTFVSAEIIQTSACLYGRDWWFGDLVTLDLPGGRSFDMRVVEVQASLGGENEEMIQGVIELWTREDEG